MNKDYGIAYMRRDNAVKVTVNEFRGTLYIHIREYICDLDDERWYPTGKGYTISPEGLDILIEKLELVSNDLAKLYRVEEQLSLPGI